MHHAGCQRKVGKGQKKAHTVEGACVAAAIECHIVWANEKVAQQRQAEEHYYSEDAREETLD
jgi:hypothetical protein